jgi:hypothetical protein
MRKLFLMLAMLAAPAQARTVTATVYDPGTTGALITAVAPTSTGASARRTHGCRVAPGSASPTATGRWWCRSLTAATATRSTCQQVLRIAYVFP